jgi:DNA-binding response OmpR family regulator
MFITIFIHKGCFQRRTIDSNEEKIKRENMNSENYRILIIEDNIDISENIADYLESKGHILDFAFDGISGLHLALTEEYDVIILDLMLPGMDGIELCQKLRKTNVKPIPILMLTARDTLKDKLEGFEAGADDYMVKPFALEELEARLKALVRRFNEKPVATLSVADLELNLNTMTLHLAGLPIELNRTCMKILKILMQASPNLVTRKDLEFALWGDMLPGSDVLRSYIYLIRRKIDTPFRSELLHTIHGTGYKLAAPDGLSS